CAAGGDDYELLMTAPPDKIALLHKAALSCGVAITPIGRIHAETGLVWTDAFGRNLSTTFQAFDHFLPNL
ncbi:MAG: thiamine-phosphate kinase, partial [Burkholderiaceae bacterium]